MAKIELVARPIDINKNIVALDHAFEKCVPDSFYNEDL